MSTEVKLILKFPSYFKKVDYWIPTISQYVYKVKGEVVISILKSSTKNMLVKSNGPYSYELMDFRNDTNLGFLTKEQINNYLEENPI